MQRRLELVSFARCSGAYLVEDDYDSEFRYDGLPSRSLYELDGGNVVYIGTFSKIMFPSMRLGYMIAASGLRLLVEAKVDYSRSRNLALTSVVFVTGLSGAYVPLGNFQLSGLTLATLVGMLLGLIFYILDKLKLTNDRDEA